MAEKIYVGQGKVVGRFGIISASVCLEDLIPHGQKSPKNGKTYVNIDISEMRAPNKWGKTHTISINDWKPDPSKRRDDHQTSPERPKEADEVRYDDDINPEDIPF